MEQRAVAIPSTNRLVTFPHSGISIKSAPKITDEHEINTRAPNERENKSPMPVINPHNKMEHGNHSHLFSVVKFRSESSEIALENKTIAMATPKKLPNLKLIGLHFHIGSQITDLSPFKKLCSRVNEINTYFLNKGFDLPIINVGGGVGIT